MKEKNQKKIGWVVFLDIYGFKAIIENSDIEEILEKLSECNCKINTIVSAIEPIPTIYSLSDSIFLFYPVEIPSLQRISILTKCIIDLQKIMLEFIAKDFPLRGGISFGEVSFGSNYLIGKPVINAVKYEQQIPAPFVWLPACELTKAEDGTTIPIIHGFMPEKIDLKNNQALLGVLIYPQPHGDFLCMVEKKCTHYGLYGPPEVAFSWFKAYEYILKFILKK